MHACVKNSGTVEQITEQSHSDYEEVDIENSGSDSSVCSLIETVYSVCSCKSDSRGKTVRKETRYQQSSHKSSCEVDGKGREASDHSQGVLPQNWGGIKSNRTVTCMVLKATINDRHKCSPLP
ncbi:hypothetical protein TNCV_1231091 [Trichonephila clavipes]|nr:hypothetical protein TNCV_1231091 [Trichonephila clavipes]